MNYAVRFPTRAKFCLEILKEKDHSEEIVVDGRVLLKWILSRRMSRCGLDSSGSEWGPVTCGREHGSGPWGSIHDEEFIVWVSNRL